MSDARPQELGKLARVVLGLLFVFVIAGVLVHGLSAGAWHRFVHDLVDRPDGPMRFRFILQPVMGAITAIRDGKADALTGRGPYLWTILNNRQQRAERLREGLNATARIILLGLVMDIVYQALVLKTFYPNEAVIISLLLAYVPYVIIRGLALRVWRRRSSAQRAQ